MPEMWDERCQDTQPPSDVAQANPSLGNLDFWRLGYSVVNPYFVTIFTPLPTLLWSQPLILTDLHYRVILISFTVILRYYFTLLLWLHVV
jgi:hypothetical protein